MSPLIAAVCTRKPALLILFWRAFWPTAGDSYFRSAWHSCASIYSVYIIKTVSLFLTAGRGRFTGGYFCKSKVCTSHSLHSKNIRKYIWEVFFIGRQRYFIIEFGIDWRDCFETRWRIGCLMKYVSFVHNLKIGFCCMQSPASEIPEAFI